MHHNNIEGDFKNPQERFNYLMKSMQVEEAKIGQISNVDSNQLIKAMEVGEIEVYSEGQLKEFHEELRKADQGGDKKDFAKAQAFVDALIPVNSCKVVDGKIVASDTVYVRKIEA